MWGVAWLGGYDSWRMLDILSNYGDVVFKELALQTGLNEPAGLDTSSQLLRG